MRPEHYKKLGTKEKEKIVDKEIAKIKDISLKEKVLEVKRTLEEAGYRLKGEKGVRFAERLVRIGDQAFNKEGKSIYTTSLRNYVEYTQEGFKDRNLLSKITGMTGEELKKEVMYVALRNAGVKSYEDLTKFKGEKKIKQNINTAKENIIEELKYQNAEKMVAELTKGMTEEQKKNVAKGYRYTQQATRNGGREMINELMRRLKGDGYKNGEFFLGLRMGQENGTEQEVDTDKIKAYYDQNFTKGEAYCNLYDKSGIYTGYVVKISNGAAVSVMREESQTWDFEEDEEE